MAEFRIKLSAPDIADDDIEEVVGVLRSGWLSLGPKVIEFEQAFANYLGVKHAIACNSGTSALHMMMLTAGIGPGDEVITSPFSFIASANCIEMVGAKPVFVDIDELSLNMDPALVEKAITPRTKAVLGVHIFGLSAENDKLKAICERHKLVYLEDACEALGATQNGRKAGDGRHGIAAAWGFYPNKQMTTGEGGMVTTNDEAFATSIRKLRNQGRNLSAAWLEHDVVGYNFRLDEMSAALGLAQLRRIDDMLAKRERVAHAYNERLWPLREHLKPLPEVMGHRRSWFVYSIMLKRHIDRDKVAAKLAEWGVQVGKYFSPPIHLQTCYRKKYGYKEGAFPVTEDIAHRSIALPFHTKLPEKDIDNVCECLHDAIKAMMK
ncbi:MAG: DegT/DnrJ/EryC1/StrS family aminotransferase [Planctomycetaceae bacterium]|nr:DegT/DnrJ/EryC1/StrS family aminotransferase [Planctomycetaceae bacterium]